jgi:phage I-like protein
MHNAIRRPLSVAVSIAACALALPAQRLSAGFDTLRIQVLPAGQFRPADGRTEGVADSGYWYVDAALASQLIGRAQARATQICVDYEHQTLHREKNGQPAPAAAWIDQASLEWVEGEGLFAVAKLTQRAADSITADEYRYFSPVFIFDKKTGAVLDLKLGALTNLPAIDGMEPLTASASATFAADMAALSQDLSTTEDTQMEELLDRLQWLLNMPVGTTAEEFAAQLDKIKAQLLGNAPEATAAASFDLAAYLATQGTKIAALNQQVTTAAKPDPAQFVPVSVMLNLQGQVAALSAKLGTADVDKTVDDAIAAGQLLPVQAGWARDLGRTNMAALSQYLESAPKIAALSGGQTDGKPPVAALASGALDDAALAVCSQLGITAEEFAKGKL